MISTVFALFERFETARQALTALVEEGYSQSAVSLVVGETEGEAGRLVNPAIQAGAESGTGSGAAADAGRSVDALAAVDPAAAATAGAGPDAVIGGPGGLQAGLGRLEVSGIGPVLASGSIVTALAGPGSGAAGGLVDALVEQGLPAGPAWQYAEGVRRGGTLMIVRTAYRPAAETVEILGRYGALALHGPSGDWSASVGRDETGPPQGSLNQEARTGAALDQGRPGGLPGKGDIPGAADRVADQPVTPEHWESSQTHLGHSQDRLQPAHTFGYELANDDQYRDRQWDDIEADARREWQVRYPNMPWEEIQAAVRKAWREESERQQ